MYLPEYHSRSSPDPRNKNSSRVCNGLLSKSCENISSEMRQIGRTPSPVVSQNNDDNRFHTEGSRAHLKKKKFTFQSTVRMIENRRLAERLSREAELKGKTLGFPTFEYSLQEKLLINFKKFTMEFGIFCRKSKT